MIYIAICDDKINIINKTKKLIQDYDKEDIDIYVYESGEELINSDKEFHIIFLDIDMKGLDGIEFAYDGMKIEDYRFEMPNKSFVVNLYNIKTIKGYDVHMMDGSVIPLSQKKSSQFRDSLNRYLSKHINKSRRD